MVSEGAAALKTAGTLSELVKRTGISKAVLAGIRSGANSPSENSVVVLERELGITRAAWGIMTPVQGPTPQGAEAADAGDDEAGDIPPIGHEASPHAHLATARAWRMRLQRTGAPPRDITGALEAERRAIELVRKCTQDDTETIIAAIFDALGAHPDAREAVAAALTTRGLR